MVNMPLLPILVYSFTLWFGLYLIGRDWHKLGLRYAGLGLVSYAVAMAIALLADDALVPVAWRYLPILLPSVFWMGAVLYLVPDVPVRAMHRHIVLMMIILVIAIFAMALTYPQWTRYIGLSLPIVFMIGMLLRLRDTINEDVPRPPLVILVTAGIFLALATGLILLPLEWLSQDWVVLAISLDLICLGYTVGVLDAYDEGTSLFSDAMRSLVSASLAILIFGGQIMLVMSITEDTSAPMLLLLFGVITSLLIVMVFYDPIQSGLDRLILTQATLRQQREDLRAASRAITRTASPLDHVEDKEFIRWTRRALSNYGDLNKLASSPLLQLPIVEKEATEDNVLAKANALKSLLREGIDQLKPESDDEFAPTDEWRYYNVLYFPYVVGLKPYSSRFYRDDLTSAEEDALQWFRTYVPERTLYNWQKTAAELVANHLRELE